MSEYSVAVTRVPGALAPSRRLMARLARLVRNQPAASASSLLLLGILVVAVIAPWVAPYSPVEQEATSGQAPDYRHWLGTDWLGRDLLSRVIHGTRISLIVGFGAVLLGTGAGALWGLVSGYLSGKTDLVSQRLLEVLMAIPPLVLAIILAAGLGSGLFTVILAVALTRVAQTARVIRGTVLTLRESDYVLAAKTVGAGPLRVMLWHVAPGCTAVFLILLTAHIGVAIVLEGTLGFLGVGVPPPHVSWGGIIGGALSRVLVPPWWLVVFPGLAITATALLFNLVGDGLRDILDPRLRGSS